MLLLQVLQTSIHAGLALRSEKTISFQREIEELVSVIQQTGMQIIQILIGKYMELFKQPLRKNLNMLIKMVGKKYCMNIPMQLIRRITCGKYITRMMKELSCLEIFLIREERHI